MHALSIHQYKQICCLCWMSWFLLFKFGVSRFQVSTVVARTLKELLQYLYPSHVFLRFKKRDTTIISHFSKGLCFKSPNLSLLLKNLVTTEKNYRYFRRNIIWWFFYSQNSINISVNIYIAWKLNTRVDIYKWKTKGKL